MKNYFIIGGANGYEYKIKLIVENPKIYRSYSVPLNLREKAEQKIKSMSVMRIKGRRVWSNMQSDKMDYQK